MILSTTMKKFAVIVIIALVHFGLSVLIIPMTRSFTAAMSTLQPEQTATFQILVAVTRILHFPVVSLSFYSRFWFPGDWIFIPILVNSFVVAVGIYFLAIICKKLVRKYN